MSQQTDPYLQGMLNHLMGQAKYFLEEEGEFYPYGTVIDADLQIKPLGYYSEEEYPEPAQVLNDLETAVREGLSSGKYLAASIGVMVMIKGEENKEDDNEASDGMKSAMQVRIYSADGNMNILYSVYEQNADGSYEFGEPFKR